MQNRTTMIGLLTAFGAALSVACASTATPRDERMSTGEYRQRVERQATPPCATQPAAPLVQGVDSLDRQAIMLPSSKAPSVPATLLDTATLGFARVVMVVAADGRVQPGSAVVLEASHADWARAVISEVPTMRFRPAERGGCAVAVRMEQPFAFRINAGPRRPPPA